MIDEDARATIRVVQGIASGKFSDAPDSLADLFVRATKLVHLFEEKNRLGSNWNRYIYDNSISILGNEAEAKIRSSRRVALSKLLSLQDKQFNSIKESMRVDIAALSAFDFEPESRAAFFKLLSRIVKTGMKSFRIGPAGNVPVNVLLADGKKMLVCLDNFHVPEKTVKEFDSREDAELFFHNFLFLLLHARERGLVDQHEVLSDQLSLKYCRNSSKFFTKGIKDEKHLRIAGMIKEGSIWEAAGALLKNDSFYSAFKYMYIPLLFSFDNGRIKITSFASEGNFTIDAAGRKNIIASIAKNKKTADGFFVSVCYLNYILSESFFAGQPYISRELDPVLPEGIGWNLPIKIFTDCTANTEAGSNGNGSISFGIKGLIIETSDNKFINIAKGDLGVLSLAADNTLINLHLSPGKQADGTLHGMAYCMPEFLSLLNAIAVNGRLDGTTAAMANIGINESRANKFNFVKSRGGMGIVSRLYDKVILLSIPSAVKGAKG